VIGIAKRVAVELRVLSFAGVEHFFSIVVTILSNICGESRPRKHFPKLNSQWGPRLN
jgi:hypothetical protein